MSSTNDEIIGLLRDIRTQLAKLTGDVSILPPNEQQALMLAAIQKAPLKEVVEFIENTPALREKAEQMAHENFVLRVDKAKNVVKDNSLDIAQQVGANAFALGKKERRFTA